MQDKMGRQVNYLRLSLTQRCNLNCSYCGNPQCSMTDDELSSEEIYKLVKAFALCGINKVRLTGGEPLMRSDLPQIIRLIAEIKDIKEITATTNGVLLTKDLAKELKKAGLKRINISLDSLNQDIYKKITGVDALFNVLKGIEAALEAGLNPLHINVVLMKGINDKEIGNFINYAKENPVTVRFIELMPFSCVDVNKTVPNSEILARYPFLKPKEPPFKGQPSIDYTAHGFLGAVGMISPVTNKFCAYCNRIRVLSDGRLKPCLGNDKTVNIRQYIDNEEQLKKVIFDAIYNKPKGHHFERGCTAGYTLQSIGG